MKMVAASRLKKAKHLVESSRPYADKIEEMISSLASNIIMRNNLSEKFPLLTGKGKNNSHLVIVFSSDRGLCGGLNSSTVKMTKTHIFDLERSGKKVKLFCVGKTAYEQLKFLHKDKVIDSEFGVFKGEITYEIAENLAQKLIKLFDENQFDVCEVIYSKFKSAIVQEQICKQIIPAKIDAAQLPESESYESPTSYEPSQEDVLSDLLPKNLAMQIYNEMLENSASEQGARMAAMESASNNAGKMIKNLTWVYNRTRQANITKELIDIISGANSV